MSIRTSTSTESFDCDAPDCDDSFFRWEAVRGSYCSELCYWHHRGEKVFRNISDDQRWCASCFRPVKEIELPPTSLTRKNTETAQAMMGFQYVTEQTVWATDESTSPNAFLPIERQRWGCDCGAVNPSARTELLQNVDPAATLSSLLACLHELHAEGNIANAPSKDALFAAYRERPKDWPYIAGHAIYCE